MEAEELLERRLAQGGGAGVAVEVRPLGEYVEALRDWSCAVLHRLDELDLDADAAARAAWRGDGGEEVEGRVVAGEPLVAAPGRGLEVDGVELRDEVGEERAE